jgi:hypothetical protein
MNGLVVFNASNGSARRLIIRGSVDLPAPERPITPTKLPGAHRCCGAAFVHSHDRRHASVMILSSSASKTNRRFEPS